jgi:hypothetical protein
MTRIEKVSIIKVKGKMYQMLDPGIHPLSAVSSTPF